MRYRVAALFAGFAFVVALVAGLAGGVRLATTLARAAAGAAVFAGLGIATVLVVERYLPELVRRPQVTGERPETAERPEPEAEAPAVDIVLPEENPLAGAIGGDLEPAEEAVAEPLEAADAGAPSESVPLVAEPADEAAGESVAGEDVDSLPSLDVAEGEPRESPAPAPARPAAGTVPAHAEPSQAARVLRTWLKRDHEG